MYLPHHVEHRFVVKMIEEPDTGLTCIFFEGDCVTVDDFHILVIDVSLMRSNCTQKSSYNSFVPLLEVDSIEVVDNGEQDERMN